VGNRSGLAATALVVCALGGCGGGKDEPAATSTAVATASAGTDEEAAVRAAFTEYNAALAAKDWDKSCTYLAPETTTKLRANVRKLGYNTIPKDCPRLLAATYGAVESQPGQKGVIEKVLKSAKVDGVDVQGNTAVIDWHADFNGTQRPVEQSARKIKGAWKLIDATS
jgi:hypothetical protein